MSLKTGGKGDGPPLPPSGGDRKEDKNAGIEQKEEEGMLLDEQVEKGAKRKGEEVLHVGAKEGGQTWVEKLKKNKKKKTAGGVEAGAGPSGQKKEETERKGGGVKQEQTEKKTKNEDADAQGSGPTPPRGKESKKMEQKEEEREEQSLYHVTFHTFVPSTWALKGEDRVVVVMSTDWKSAVPLDLLDHVEAEGGEFYSATCSVPRTFQYKYGVLRRRADKVEYEDIDPQLGGSIWNRHLQIPDWVSMQSVHVVLDPPCNPPKGMWKRIKDAFVGSETSGWKGYLGLLEQELANLRDAGFIVSYEPIRTHLQRLKSPQIMRPDGAYPISWRNLPDALVQDVFWGLLIRTVAARTARGRFERSMFLATLLPTVGSLGNINTERFESFKDILALCNPYIPHDREETPPHDWVREILETLKRGGFLDATAMGLTEFLDVVNRRGSPDWLHVVPMLHFTKLGYMPHDLIGAHAKDDPVAKGLVEKRFRPIDKEKELEAVLSLLDGALAADPLLGFVILLAATTQSLPMVLGHLSGKVSTGHMAESLSQRVDPGRGQSYRGWSTGSLSAPSNDFLRTLTTAISIAAKAPAYPPIENEDPIEIRRAKANIHNTAMNSCENLMASILNLVSRNPPLGNDNMCKLVVGALEMVCLQMLQFSAQRGETHEGAFVTENVQKVVKAVNTNFLGKPGVFGDPSGMQRNLAEVRLWENILQVPFPESSHYAMELEIPLEERLERLSAKEVILFSCNISRNQFPRFGRVLSRRCDQALRQLAEGATADQSDLLQVLGGDIERGSTSEAGQVLGTLLLLAQSHESCSALADILSWPLWTAFFRLFVGEGNQRAQMLVSDAQALLRTAHATVVDACVAVENRQVTPNQVRQLSEGADAFEALARYSGHAGVAPVLAGRAMEMAAFHRVQEYVASFLHLCSPNVVTVPVDDGGLTAASQQPTHMRPLRDLCGPIATNDQLLLAQPQRSDVEEIAATTVFYGPPVTQLDALLVVLHHLRPTIFFRMWQDAGASANQTATGDPLDMADVIEIVATPALQRYCAFANKVRTGTVTLGELHQTNIRRLARREEIERELGAMARALGNWQGGRWQDIALPAWVAQRTNQITEQKRLRAVADVAQLVLDVCRHAIIPTDGSFALVSQLAESRRAVAARTLDTITKELGDTGSQLERIGPALRRFLSALCRCGGPSGLIAWLNTPDLRNQAEFNEFVTLCAQQEQPMDADTVSHLHTVRSALAPVLDLADLPTVHFTEFIAAMRRIDTSLEGDEGLPEKLAGVNERLEWLKKLKEETTSTAAVQAFAKVKAINQGGTYHIRLGEANTLYLTLPGRRGGADTETLYLDDLKELQSKLVLVTSEEGFRDEVEQFISLLEELLGLHSVLCKLQQAGSIAHQAYSCDFICPTVVLQDVEKQREALQQELDQWVLRVGQQRARHYALNMYTMQQLLAIYRLATCAKEGRATDADMYELVCLLRCVAPNLSKQQALRCIKTHDFGPTSNRQRNSGPMGTQTDEEQLAVAMEMSMLDDEGQRLLMEALKVSRMDVDDPCDPHRDFLDALAGLLNTIQASTSPIKLVRQYGDTPLVPGSPHLVVVPERGLVLSAVLALYLRPNLKPVDVMGRRLPTSEEVLMCSPTTSIEQVELHVQRARGTVDSHRTEHWQSRVYCLAGADWLNYDVQQALVEAVVASHTPGMRLAIITHNESAYVTSALSAYRMEFPLPPVDRLRNLLEENLPLQWSAGSDDYPIVPVHMVGPSATVVVSQRAGMGKTQWIREQAEGGFKLLRADNVLVEGLGWDCLATKIVLQENMGSLTAHLVDQLGLQFTADKAQFGWELREHLPTTHHYDISSTVEGDLDGLFFQWLVLDVLTDTQGRVRHRAHCHRHLLELPPSASHVDHKRHDTFLRTLLPTQHVQSPVIGRLSRELLSCDLLDTVTFQRPAFYLLALSQGTIGHAVYTGNHRMSRQVVFETLQRVFVQESGVGHPSTSMLHRFALYLDHYLAALDDPMHTFSAFLSPAVANEQWPDLREALVRFIVILARDFAAPSLSLVERAGGQHDPDVAQYQIRAGRQWTGQPHPYLLLNVGQGLTLFGFTVNRQTGTFDGIPNFRFRLSPATLNNLALNRLELNPTYQTRDDFHRLLLQVMVGEHLLDRQDRDDKNYLLTIDNVKKMLAMWTRVEAGIPVVIMGETGCGKTHLVHYMFSTLLQWRLLNVHVNGGTTRDDLVKTVTEANGCARSGQDVVVFFDEVNACEHMGLIKEILCDRTCGGAPVHHNARFVAACNPYRLHTAGMIQRLEQAGLGYHVSTDTTAAQGARIGATPLRNLVYRVQPLPPSVAELVWDFGQLEAGVEGQYIQAIVRSSLYDPDTCLTNAPIHPSLINPLSTLLQRCQAYLRSRQDETSFVSIRDVKRFTRVFAWFHDHHDMFQYWRLSERELHQMREDEGWDGDTSTAQNIPLPLAGGAAGHNCILCCANALFVCYSARLENSTAFHEHVVSSLANGGPFLSVPMPGGRAGVERVMLHTQMEFLDNMRNIPANISCNRALRENLFMCVVCIELGIPLFVVGKPGSSKSLAVSLGKDAMHGPNSKTPFFRRLKEVSLFSYQCSQLSTAQSIVDTVTVAKNFQRQKDPTTFTAVVRLDEIGLAEDSPLMPLKVLHSLLEEGQVSFVCTSNWALDPAKMNRGIYLVRKTPSQTELVRSAEGICSASKGSRQAALLQPMLGPLAGAYTEVCESLPMELREFFGLRDLYYLLKMLDYHVLNSTEEGTLPMWRVEAAIRRNFGGLNNVEQVVDIFFKCLGTAVPSRIGRVPGMTVMDLLRENLLHQGVTQGGDGGAQGRYLLLLTDHYGAYHMLFEHGLLAKDATRVLFGSKFPGDLEYTQVCRNINSVKVCMETGQTVLLLNLESMYESLYDCLNQYYTRFSGRSYVELGLGTHRIKCKIHEDFRLVVVAERRAVYESFPVPLINRLEKHILTTESLLTDDHQALVTQLEGWVRDFSTLLPQYAQQNAANRTVFVGYYGRSHLALLLLHAQAAQGVAIAPIRDSGKGKEPMDVDGEGLGLVDAVKGMLLNMATPESVLTLPYTRVAGQADIICSTYFQGGAHENLRNFVSKHLANDRTPGGQSFTITTHAPIAATPDLLASISLDINHAEVCRAINLQQFNTERQFVDVISEFFTHASRSMSEDSPVLLVSCDMRVISEPLVAGAQHVVERQRNVAVQKAMQAGGSGWKELVAACHVVFLLHVPRQNGRLGDMEGQGVASSGTNLWHLDTILPAAMPANPDMLLVEAVALFGKGVPLSDLLDIWATTPATPMDITRLIRDTIPSALSRLHYSGEGPSMGIDATSKIRLLMDCYDVHAELRDRMVRLVLDVVKSRDRAMGELLAHSWLTRLAGNHALLSAAGTLRAAIFAHIQSVVASALACVLAVCDRYGNISSLDQTEDFPVHMAGPWIKLFCESPIIQKEVEGSWEKLGHSSDKLGSGRILVESVRERGRCHLPFSWLLVDALDRPRDVIMARAANTSEAPNQQLSRLEGDTVSSFVSYWLCAPDTTEDTILKAYQHDLIVFNIRPAHAEEFPVEVFTQSLLRCARAIADSNGRQPNAMEVDDQETAESDDHGHSPLVGLIAAAHVALWTKAEVYGTLRCLLDAMPEDMHMALIVDGEDGSKSEEVRMLECVIGHIQPAPATLTTAKTRAEWCALIRGVRPSVDGLLAAATPHGAGDQDELDAATAQLSRLWSCALATVLFCDVIYQGPALVDLPVDPAEFWVLLEAHGGDFTSDGLVSALKRYLMDSLVDNVGKALWRYGPLCLANCDTKYGNRVLPCGHVMCDGCLEEAPRCPVNCPQAGDAHASEQLDAVVAVCKALDARAQALFVQLVTRFTLFGAHHGRIGPLSPALVCQLVTSVLNPAGDEGDMLRLVVLMLLLQADGATVGVVRANIERQMEQNQRWRYMTSYHDHLCRLVAYCMQGLIHVQCSGGQAVVRATQVLRGPAGSIIPRLGARPSLTGLEEVAGFRFAILTAANHLMAAANGGGINSGLLNALQRLADGQQAEIIRLCLVDTLQVVHGVGVLLRVAQTPSVSRALPWIHDWASQLAVPDPFTIYGNNYHNIKSVLFRALNEDASSADATIRQMFRQAAGHQFTQQRLSLLASVRLLHERPDLGPNMRRLWQSSFEGTPILPLAQVLINHVIGLLEQQPEGRPRVVPGHVYAMVAIATALGLRAEKNAECPLVKALTRPQVLARCHLPTMPQDDRMEVIRQVVQNYGGSFIECPQGHPVYVDACGRPTEIRQCRQCGANVGGIDHNLLPDNRQLRADNMAPSTGHVLGMGSTRPPLIPMRGLSATSVGLTRSLLHSALLAATICKRNTQSLYGNNIHERVESPNAFYEQHLNRDLQELAHCLQRSQDACVALLVHVATSLICQDQNSQAPYLAIESPAHQQQWEAEFAARYLAPALQSVDTVVRAMDEVRNQHERVEVPSALAYRPPITLDTFGQYLDRNSGQDQDTPAVQVLRAYLQSASQLQWVAALPIIAEWHSLAYKYFDRRFTWNEASTVSVQDAIYQCTLPAHSKTRAQFLLQAMCEAWQGCWQFIGRDVEALGFKVTMVPRMEAPLCVFLPTTRAESMGLATLAAFLGNSHNTFLETCCRLMKEEGAGSISLEDLRELHVIGCRPDKDLLPLVLACASYNLAPNENNSDIRFDCPAIASQLLDEHIRGRPFIAKVNGTVQPKRLLRYLNDIDHNYNTLLAAATAVPQVGLGVERQSQLLSAARSAHPQTTATLTAALEVVLSFMQTASYVDPHQALGTYVQGTLCMGEAAECLAAFTACRLDMQHVVELWQVLAVSTAQRLTAAGQDPFQALKDRSAQPLDKGQAQSLHEVLLSLPTTYGSNILFSLHHLLAFRLPQDAFSASYNLAEALCDAHDNCDAALFQVLHPPMARAALERLQRLLPSSITVGHARAFWAEITRALV